MALMEDLMAKAAGLCEVIKSLKTSGDNTVYDNLRMILLLNCLMSS